MAHPNIDERREAVASCMEEQDGPLPMYQRRELADKFGCSPAAIYADMLYLTRGETITPHVSAAMRRAVAARDTGCQYCLETDYNLIVEHIIPASRGGVARLYNLVLSCDSCNCKKGRNVWLPVNLDAITRDHPKWGERVRSEAIRSLLAAAL